jgi:hypothetical protein
MWPLNDGTHDDDKDIEGRDQQQFHCTIIVGSPSIQLNYSLYVKYSCDVITIRLATSGRTDSQGIPPTTSDHTDSQGVPPTT